MEVFFKKFDIGLFILAVFATVGIYRILELFIERILSRTKKESFLRKPQLLILVKDLEDKVEGMMRLLASRGVFEMADKIYVCDLGSKDKTVDILERLSQKFGFDVENGLKKLPEGDFVLAFNMKNIAPEKIAAYFERLCDVEKVELGLKSHEN